MRAVLLLLALCLCAQVLAVPTIVSTVAANLQTMSQFEFSSVSPVNGVQAKIGMYYIKKRNDIVVTDHFHQAT